MNIANLNIINYLEEQKDHIIQKWSKTFNLPEMNEPISNSGLKMFQIIVDSLCKGKVESFRLQLLAEEIATNCLSIEITKILHDINIAKSIFYEFIFHIELPVKELAGCFKRLNEIYDELTLNIISYYVDIKKKEDIKQQQLNLETHNERLTILGRMTSSFVHECKNPLTAIIGFMQLLKTEQPNLKYMDIIERELQQLDYRISQFLLLSKKETIGKEKQVFTIESLLLEVIDFLYPSIADTNIDITQELLPLSICGYRDEIKQVFVNIIFNSIDALSQKKGKRKVIIQMQENNGKVFVKISNNGPKIPPESLNTIFQPFVTTKQMGTGLGLFVCQEIIKKHNGEIFCNSSDLLTTFTIRLDVHR